MGYWCAHIGYGTVRNVEEADFYLGGSSRPALRFAFGTPSSRFLGCAVLASFEGATEREVVLDRLLSAAAPAL